MRIWRAVVDCALVLGAGHGGLGEWSVTPEPDGTVESHYEEGMVAEFSAA